MDCSFTAKQSEIYLKERVFDFGLLPLISGPEFEFPALLDLADSAFLTLSFKFNRQLWYSLGAKHLNLNEEQCNVYFDYFIVWSGVGADTDFVKADAFVLFLFNQLFGKANLDDSIKDGDSYPNVIASSTFRRKRTRTPPSALLFSTSHVSSESVVVSSAEGDSTAAKTSRLPSLLVEGRSNLAAFWLSNASQWQSLLYVLHHGRHLDLPSLKAQAVEPAKQQTLSDKFWGPVLEFSLSSLSVLDEFFDCGIEGQASMLITAIKRALGPAVADSKLPMSAFYEFFTENMCISSSDRTQSSTLYVVRKRNRSFVLAPSETANRSVILQGLVGCHVYVLGPVSNVLLQQSLQTSVTLCACSGIVQVDDCSSVVVRSASRQFMCSSTSGALFYLRTCNAPIIASGKRDRKIGWSEMYCGRYAEKLVCSDIVLAPFNVVCSDMLINWREAGLAFDGKQQWSNPTFVWSVPFTDNSTRLHSRRSTEESSMSDKSSGLSESPMPLSVSPVSFGEMTHGPTLTCLERSAETHSPSAMLESEPFAAVGDSFATPSSDLGPASGVYLLPPPLFSEHILPFASASPSPGNLLDYSESLGLPLAYVDGLKHRDKVSVCSNKALLRVFESLESKPEFAALKQEIDDMFLLWMKQQPPVSAAFNQQQKFKDCFYPSSQPLPCHPDGSVPTWKATIKFSDTSKSLL